MAKEQEEDTMTSLERFVFVDEDGRAGKIVNTAERRLTLAYEALTEMPRNLIGDYGNLIETLDLSHNKLANVDFLSQFDNLTTLILDHNNIASEVIFPTIPSLTTLWLNHNLINKLHPFMQNVSKSFPTLQFLSLMGNAGAPSYLNGGTYYEYLQYRLFVVSWLPHLKYLDDRPVTQGETSLKSFQSQSFISYTEESFTEQVCFLDQREEAQRLYSRPFYHVLMNLPFPQYLHHVQQKFKCLCDSWALKPPSSAPPARQNRII